MSLKLIFTKFTLGHVPRKNFFCGKGYQEECRRGIADFEKLQRERRYEQDAYKYCPPEDLLVSLSHLGKNK